MAPSLTFVYNEIIELSKHHELLIITNERLNEKQFPFNNVTVIPFLQNKITKKIFWLLEKNNIWLSRKNSVFKQNLNTTLNTFKPDLIHLHFGYESIIFADNYVNRNIPVYISFHGYDASQMLRNKVYVNKLNDLFKDKNFTAICVSDFIKNHLINYGVKLTNYKLLYYGINVDLFEPKRPNKTNNQFIFLQISVFNEKKGHKYTLDAFKLFLEKVENKNNYKLILAGGLNLLESIKKYTNDIGLSPYVEFPGAVNHTQAKELYNSANVFLHHSITAKNGDTEGLPNVIIEAMAMELPIVSTYHAGIPELVEHGINGFLVKEKDVLTYAKYLLEIVNWSYLKINREKILTRFSNEIHLKNLLSIYANIQLINNNKQIAQSIVKSNKPQKNISNHRRARGE
jgi:glycosyltransferase involved in cell wall biosynthesis